MSNNEIKIVRIKSPEHSEKVQKHLFSLGYVWGDWKGKIGMDVREVRHTEKPILEILEDRKVIFWTYLYDYSRDHPHELELIETVSYELKEVPKKEVVTIGEKSYYKDELEVALKNINPI